VEVLLHWRYPSTTNAVFYGAPSPSDWRFSWHKAGENVLFCDGHVGQLKRAQLFDIKVAAPQWNNDNQPTQKRGEK